MHWAGTESYVGLQKAIVIGESMSMCHPSFTEGLSPPSDQEVEQCRLIEPLMPAKRNQCLIESHSLYDSTVVSYIFVLLEKRPVNSTIKLQSEKKTF